MKIHAKFDVDNVKDIPCRAAAYFYFNSGGKLTSNSNSYGTSDGQVCVSDGFTPPHEGTMYNNFELFMPYGELNMADGKHDLKFYIKLYVKGGDFFADSNWVYFTYG
jgi:hypothetical protein